MRWSFSSVAGSQSGLDSNTITKAATPGRADEVVCDHEKRKRMNSKGHGTCHSPAAMDSRSTWGPDIYGWPLALSTHTCSSSDDGMQVGPSIPLKPGFIAQNQSRYEELYGCELKDRNRQGGPLGYIFPLQAFSSPPSFPPSKTKLLLSSREHSF